MTAQPHNRCLLIREQVIAKLQLPNDKVQQVIDTRQILPIRITGEERFDSLDIDQLISSYVTTASRRIQ
jgi:hypothetical protein